MDMTYGERRVAALAAQLPGDRYYTLHEPILAGAPTSRQRPDFVVISARLGVIVLEVKDWQSIRRMTQKTFEVERSGGLESVMSPVEQARQYALNLADAAKRRKALIELHRGQRMLRFPWRYAAVLTHVARSTIIDAERRGLWEVGQVLGRDDLISEKTFENALQRIPSRFPMKNDLDDETQAALKDLLEPSITVAGSRLNRVDLDFMRGVLDPRVVILDSARRDIGELTREQEKLITEPIAFDDMRQLSLFGETGTTTDTRIPVRLVRGVAGSGKSLVLARRAWRLAIDHPDREFLVVAFNVDLVDDIERRTRTEHRRQMEMLNTPDAPYPTNLTVKNFHGVCSAILKGVWVSPVEAEKWAVQVASDLISAHHFDADFVGKEIEWRKELRLDNAAYLTVERRGRGRALVPSKRQPINEIYDRYQTALQEQHKIDWADVPFSALDALTPDHPMAERYDSILIDEAQDFAPSWIQVILRLLKPGGTLFICDDPTQGLFRSFSWRQKGLTLQAGNSRALTIPFRSTRGIMTAARALIQADAALSQSRDVLEPDLDTYELPAGETPRLQLAPDDGGQIDFIREAVRAWLTDGLPADQIAILTHDWAAHGKPIQEALREAGIAVREKRRNGKHEDDAPAVYLSSFRSMKGLEFQAVIVPDLHTLFEQDEALKDETFVTEKRRALYVAMTRARKRLLLTAIGTLPPELDALTAYVESG